MEGDEDVSLEELASDVIKIKKSFYDSNGNVISVVIHQDISFLIELIQAISESDVPKDSHQEIDGKGSSHRPSYNLFHSSSRRSLQFLRDRKKKKSEEITIFK